VSRDVELSKLFALIERWHIQLWLPKVGQAPYEAFMRLTSYWIENREREPMNLLLQLILLEKSSFDEHSRARHTDIREPAANNRFAESPLFDRLLRYLGEP
jgi:hypothetical protein